ncbi:FAD-dependent monooxygenase [Bradyrhizobium sp. 24]|uniref:FAD-dependent monooxygenase n=1 Tax=unclassified Bradyrhizobium TaxID=2631580 RepID=UPI001FF6FD4B|nr:MULTISPECIES: FAD-dependent monooxygenase [unclassified Bradyrhizobium]MCK1303531.1 FAD-dependent monooxygenase [Bradyrhizobium sp. 37]MCK1380263.1 FAD-dependent monooxygenase [Bradyrhizobium sp. 24]MCK1770606.1 FAD-dependent monooxygenase [Bradyrhizobium sp. 134]
MPVLLPTSRTRDHSKGPGARRAQDHVQDRVKDHAVVIAGAGPTGLMLAAELALANVDVAVVERRADQELVGTRAGGLHARSIEILDQRGVADRFLREGQITQLAGFAWTRLDISDLPTRHAYGLVLRQSHIERILADWVSELAVPIYRNREMTGFAQDETGIDVTLSGGETLRANYLVGCDGGRSLVRKAAGIDFAGSDPTLSNLMAEVEMREEPAWGLRHDALGFHGLSKTESGRVLVVVTEATLDRTGAPGPRDLSDALVAVYGTDFGLQNPSWISRFADAARQAVSYRKRRVLLAGDAAHIHHSVGGQGLNTGVQDAVNLGWKLAQVVKGLSPETLLDTYHAERHPVAARTLRNTMAQIALLRRGEDGLKAAREIFSELLGMDEPRKRFGAMMSGLDVHYDLGQGHALLGRRMPDLDLTVEGRPLRLFTLLRGARGLLFNFGEKNSFDTAPWVDRIKTVDVEHDGAWELPTVGQVAAPSAVLVRPDGHVAWVRDQGHDGLADALTRWFGAPAA